MILIVLSFFIHPVKNIEKTGNYDSIYNKDNKYGLYLSSFRAEIMGDYLNLNNIYSEAVSQNKRDFLGKSFIINAIQNNEKEAIIDAENEIIKNGVNLFLFFIYSPTIKIIAQKKEKYFIFLLLF